MARAAARLWGSGAAGRPCGTVRVRVRVRARVWVRVSVGVRVRVRARVSGDVSVSAALGLVCGRAIAALQKW